MGEAVRHVHEREQHEIAGALVRASVERAREPRHQRFDPLVDRLELPAQLSELHLEQLAAAERVEQERVLRVIEAVVVHRQRDGLGARKRLGRGDGHGQGALLRASRGTQPGVREQLGERVEAVVDRADGNAGRARDRLDGGAPRPARDDDLARGVEDRFGGEHVSGQEAVEYTF